MATIFSKTAYCNAWGGEKNARRVHGLTAEERAAIRGGADVMMEGPEYQGVTTRRIIEISGRFYARMPSK